MIVLGAHFGDEGKGLATSFLCSQTTNPLVVRFNGGQQAGHTVVYNGKRHVFSSFGSGTLQGVPTYWSKHCTFYPPSFLREYELLGSPKIYVNPLCPVTTYFDIDHNRSDFKNKTHGTVGMGFGATIEREEDHFHLYVQDLFYPDILRAKLRKIATYYNRPFDTEAEEFMMLCANAIDHIELSDDSILLRYMPIFEGAQGILLDMDFGFFPNVTRSNTTSKNAMAMYGCKDIYYVTRTYLTRHGNGYLPDEMSLQLTNNTEETNKSHKYQGHFRTAPLNFSLLNYAIGCDDHFSKGVRKNLIITCNDQWEINVEQLLSALKFKINKVYLSHGDSLTDIKEWQRKSYQQQ